MNVNELPLDTYSSQEGLVDAQRLITERGWVHTNDATLGLKPEVREHTLEIYFADGALGGEAPGVWPADRKRARALIEYRREYDRLLLAAYPDTGMPPRYNYPDQPRMYKRSSALESPLVRSWVATYLMLVPPGERATDGTVDLNLLRTFQDVVPFPHRDGEQFTCIYVVDRQAEGATTFLYSIEDLREGENRKAMLAPHARPLYETILMPGDWLVFRDKDFAHETTPLRPRWPDDTSYHRDTIVSLVYHSTTYPKRYIAAAGGE